MLDLNQIISEFYGPSGDLRRMLCRHSSQVYYKAMDIMRRAAWRDPSRTLDSGEVLCAAFLHDIGIVKCHAPSILCIGNEPYIAHGTIGADMLNAYAAAHDLNLDCFARIAARHTGAGLSADDIAEQNLPLPKVDLCPETPLETLICLADKFFSKSNLNCEKSFYEARRSLEKFGPETLKRFDSMCVFWKLGE